MGSVEEELQSKTFTDSDMLKERSCVKNLGRLASRVLRPQHDKK